MGSSAQHWGRGLGPSQRDIKLRPCSRLLSMGSCRPPGLYDVGQLSAVRVSAQLFHAVLQPAGLLHRLAGLAHRQRQPVVHCRATGTRSGDCRGNSGTVRGLPGQQGHGQGTAGATGGTVRELPGKQGHGQGTAGATGARSGTARAAGERSGDCRGNRGTVRELPGQQGARSGDCRGNRGTVSGLPGQQGHRQGTARATGA